MKVRALIENLDECEPISAWDLDLGELNKECAKIAKKDGAIRAVRAFLQCDRRDRAFRRSQAYGAGEGDGMIIETIEAGEDQA